MKPRSRKHPPWFAEDSKAKHFPPELDHIAHLRACHLPLKLWLHTYAGDKGFDIVDSPSVTALTWFKDHPHFSALFEGAGRKDSVKRSTCLIFQEIMDGAFWCRLELSYAARVSIGFFPS